MSKVIAKSVRAGFILCTGALFVSATPASAQGVRTSHRYGTLVVERCLPTTDSNASRTDRCKDGEIPGVDTRCEDKCQSVAEASNIDPREREVLASMSDRCSVQVDELKSGQKVVTVIDPQGAIKNFSGTVGTKFRPTRQAADGMSYTQYNLKDLKRAAADTSMLVTLETDSKGKELKVKQLDITRDLDAGLSRHDTTSARRGYLRFRCKDMSETPRVQGSGSSHSSSENSGGAESGTR